MSLNTIEIQKTEKLVYYIFTPAILLYSLFLTLYARDGFPPLEHLYSFMPYVSDKLIGEDGYYMLTVAWNMALGQGIAYNFGESTTGIQPLATFLYALIAKLVQALNYDKFVFARWVFFLNTLLFLYFSHQIAKLSTIITKGADKSTVYLIAFSISAFNLVLFKHFTYGLETGLYLTLLAITISYSLSHDIKSTKSIVTFGALIGFTGLARIDFGIIFFIFFLLKVRSNKDYFYPLVLTGIVALITISPWFIYTYQVSGNWIPSSGGAQASLITSFDLLLERTLKMVAGISDNIVPFIYAPKTFLAVVATTISTVGLYLLVKYAVFSEINREYKYWLYGVLTIIAIYVTVFWAAHFYARYSAPIVIFSIPLFAILISKVLKNTKFIKYGISLCLAMFFIFSLVVYHRGAINNSHAISAGYILENYPNKTIGAFQSGVIGYFGDNTHNLDGKLNHISLKHLKDGNIHKVIDNKDIDVIIDWDSYIQNIDNGYLESNFVLAESLSNGSHVFVRK